MARASRPMTGWRPRLLAIPAGGAMGALVAGTLTWQAAHRFPGPSILLLFTTAGGGVALLMRLGVDALQAWLEPRISRWAPERVARVGLGAFLLWYTALMVGCLSAIDALGFHLLRVPFAAPLVYLFGLAGAAMTGGVTLLTRLMAVGRNLAVTEAQAHLLAFQSRFQPHTIFNALNAIAALIPEAPERAEQGVEQLARVLRTILRALELERWSLREEFAMLEDLLALERLRFGDRLTYTLELPGALEAQELPPLVLLPLVENALKHGFRPKVGPCRLRVRADEEGILIEDDGVGRRPDAQEGLGLRMTRERLEAWGAAMRWLPGEGCAVRIAPRSGGGEQRT